MLFVMDGDGGKNLREGVVKRGDHREGGEGGCGDGGS